MYRILCRGLISREEAVQVYLIGRRDQGGGRQSFGPMGERRVVPRVIIETLFVLPRSHAKEDEVCLL